MDLNLDMSSLSISHKKRRLSGLLHMMPSENEHYITDETPAPADNDNIQPTELPETSPSPQSEASDYELNKTNSEEPRRSSRLRATPPPITNVEPSTSVTAAATTLNHFDIERDYKHLKKIYLDKRVKKTCPSLETIFEIPNDEKIMSGRKFKRFISFQELQKNKVRKRPLKAKHTSHVKIKKKNKVTMDALMKKLNDLDCETD